MRAALLAPALLAACTMTPPPVPVAVDTVPADGTVTYTCGDGRTLPVTYGQENGEAAVRLDPDGQGPNLLLRDLSAPGLRYAWPSDGSHPVWEVAGGVGTLSYRDGARGVTTVLATDCRPA